MSNESTYTMYRDASGELYKDGPVTVKETVISSNTESIRVHKIRDYCDRENTHPLLSEFIADLAAIYKNYGDGYVCNSANEYTHELFGNVSITEKVVEGLPSENGKSKTIRYIDIA